jgi:protein-ribulosamine 3-kinase
MLTNQMMDHLRRQLGGVNIENVRPVHQSIAHIAYRFQANGSSFLLKIAESQFMKSMTSEYLGLKYLRDSKCIRTPEIIDFQVGNEELPTYLLVEWIERGSSTAAGQKQLGEELAALHDASSEIFDIHQFGFEEDNYIGNNRQYNTWHSEWPAFFVQQRLKPQIQMGVKKGFIDNQFRNQLNRLCEKMPQLLGAQHFVPCLLHGDLWGGNVLFDSENRPVLIDPAAYFGVPEAELAFTEMFGGFTRDFYAAYDSVLPIPYGYKERKKLYNLYHVLNHMNLFGQMYLHEAKAICSFYIGR